MSYENNSSNRLRGIFDFFFVRSFIVLLSISFAVFKYFIYCYLLFANVSFRELPTRKFKRLLILNNFANQKISNKKIRNQK